MRTVTASMAATTDKFLARESPNRRRSPSQPRQSARAAGPGVAHALKCIHTCSQRGQEWTCFPERQPGSAPGIGAHHGQSARCSRAQAPSCSHSTSHVGQQ